METTNNQVTVQKDLFNPENQYGPTKKQVEAIQNKVAWLSGSDASLVITILDALFTQHKQRAEYKKNLAAKDGAQTSTPSPA